MLTLRRQLLTRSPRQVAEAFWTTFWAAQPEDSPDPDQEEVGHMLERLACEPGFFRQLTRALD